MWQEFVDNTTLHGIRYVFKKPRHILIRLIWFVLLLTSGGYYIFTVYTAFITYFDRPINTVVSSKNVEGMDFAAVTICPQNDFTKSKLYMTDDKPLFASTRLNISACARYFKSKRRATLWMVTSLRFAWISNLPPRYTKLHESIQ